MHPQQMNRPVPLMRRLLAADSITSSVLDWPREIAQSLMYLLNTHQGSAMIAEDFGLPDFNPEAVSTHYLRHYEQSMKRLIHQYEPRLSEVEVLGCIDMEYKNRLIFHFRGVLELVYATQKIHYCSVMTEYGRVMMQVTT